MNQATITYRNIAKMLASALPIEDEEFREVVESNLKTIKAMPKGQKVALRSAYIFSRKVPKEEREDLFQELTLAILEQGVDCERLAYAIAKCDWQDWWAKFKVRSHFLAGSLNARLEDSEGQEYEFGELLVGEVEFERKMQGKIDGQALYSKLPEAIKPIVTKRLLGRALTDVERKRLSRYVKQAPLILVN